jgi:hypothetical protein
VRKGRIDYRMQRRAAVRDVLTGLRDPQEVRDAHPDLIRAGTHIGSPVDDACPLCEQHGLRHVLYVFRDRDARTQGGRAVARDMLQAQVERYGDLSVYAVEVCLECHWHHLVESYLLIARDTAAG